MEILTDKELQELEVREVESADGSPESEERLMKGKTTRETVKEKTQRLQLFGDLPEKPEDPTTTVFELVSTLQLSYRKSDKQLKL